MPPPPQPTTTKKSSGRNGRRAGPFAPSFLPAQADRHSLLLLLLLLLLLATASALAALDSYAKGPIASQLTSQVPSASRCGSSSSVRLR